MEKVSWDDFPFPTDWKNKIQVPNHQPEYNFSWLKPIPISYSRTIIPFS
jgi:hypothetical protein